MFFPDAPTVSDLSLSQISKLADLLDTDNGWEDFAAFAFENDDVILKQVRNLHRHYWGGGNPAHSFLIRLTQLLPMLTVKDFVSRCRSCERNDIDLYASNVLKKDNFTLKNLEDRELRDFADEICGNGRCISDWRDIASTFPEFTPEDIRKLEETKQGPNRNSPTKELFHKIRQINPTFKLEDLKKSCERKELRRMDVALKLGKFIDELSVK